MHSATLNHIRLIKNPKFNLTSKITMDEDGAQRLQQLKFLAFRSSGKCCFVFFTGNIRWLMIPDRLYQ